MSLKDFKNCDVKYAYDNNNEVYSVKIMFRGKPMVLTMRVGKDIMDMTLTDINGRVIEYIGQKKKLLEFSQNPQLASQLKKAK